MPGIGNGEKDNALEAERRKHVARIESRLLAGRIGEYTTNDHETFSYELSEPLYRKVSSEEEFDKLVSKGHPEYRKVLGERLDLHIEKSSGYGTGDDPFANFTAVANLTGQPRYLYPVHRTIEKLTRVLSLHAQGRYWDLEEEFKDCASLLDCATALLREDTTKRSLELVRPCRHIYDVESCPDCTRKG